MVHAEVATDEIVNDEIEEYIDLRSVGWQRSLFGMKHHCHTDLKWKQWTLRDIMSSEKSFGGKVIVLSGDFPQCSPVIPHASRAEITNAALNRSLLWHNFVVFQLKEKMRVQMSNNPDSLWFDNFTLSLGDWAKKQ